MKSASTAASCHRTSRAIPFDRVTDVDLEQGPLQRLLGLAKVKLETGASAGSKEEEGVLHTISLARAEALREHIRARKGLAPAPRRRRCEAEGPPFSPWTCARVLTAGLFNFSLAVIAGLFGVNPDDRATLGFDPFERQLLARPARAVRTASAAGHGAPDRRGRSPARSCLILLGIGTGLVRTVLREYGFRLDRTETGFRRRRGLLTLTDVTIPAKRAQAAILANGPMRGSISAGGC